MAFCRNCGKEIEENHPFCPYCGVDTGIPKKEPEVNKSSFMDTPEIEVDPSDAEKNRVMGVLSYLGILVLVPLLAAPDSKFARFHANQGLLLLIAEVALGIVLGLVSGLFWVLGLGFIEDIADAALSIGSLTLMVIGIVNAAKGKAKELPIIGKYRILK